LRLDFDVRRLGTGMRFFLIISLTVG
jgi:hypothetical protein